MLGAAEQMESFVSCFHQLLDGSKMLRCYFRRHREWSNSYSRAHPTQALIQTWGRVRNLFSKNGKASACFYQSATLKWCSRRKIKHDITLQMSDNVSHNFVLPSSICWISVALVLRWKYGDWGGNADERLPYLQGKSRKITSHTENEKREST